MSADLLQEFVLLWTVVDPIGTLPVFIAATTHLDAVNSRRLAMRAVALAAGLLLFFALAGEWLLQAMAIPLSAFQTAGGLILFLFALTMIFGPGKPKSEIQGLADSGDTAVYPLAIPSIASPGAILAIVMMTDSHRHSFVDQAITGALMALVLAATLALLLAARWLQRYLDGTVASVISRIMGLLLSAVAINSVMQGVALYYGIQHETSP